MYNIGVMRVFIKSSIFVVTLFLVAGVLFVGGYVKAQHSDLNDVAPIELIEFIPEKEFKGKTKVIEHTPNDDIHLGYQVRVPTDWGDNTAKQELTLDGSFLGKKVLSVIARYTSPANPQYPRSFFTVEGMQLTYEVGVKNWFVNYALTNGLSLERMTVKGKKELEAIYVEVKKDTAYIVRTKVVINGSKVIVARYYVAQQGYKSERIIQAQVIDSFQLLSLDSGSIEDLTTFGFLNQSYFDYPPSWQLDAPPVTTIEEMRAQLHNNIVEGKLNGQIDILLNNRLAVSSRSEVIKKFREDFSVDNYTVDKLIESRDFEYHKDMSFGATQAYELNPTSSSMLAYELWLSVLEGEDYIYLISLITPSRKDEFYTWAKNIESYKLIVKTMRRNNDFGNLYDDPDR